MFIYFLWKIPKVLWNFSVWDNAVKQLIKQPPSSFKLQAAERFQCRHYMAAFYKVWVKRISYKASPPENKWLLVFVSPCMWSVFERLVCNPTVLPLLSASSQVATLINYLRGIHWHRTKWRVPLLRGHKESCRDLYRASVINSDWVRPCRVQEKKTLSCMSIWTLTNEPSSDAPNSSCSLQKVLICVSVGSIQTFLKALTSFFVSSLGCQVLLV